MNQSPYNSTHTENSVISNKSSITVSKMKKL